MDKWQHIGLVVMQEWLEDESCSEISQKIGQSIPGFYEHKFNLERQIAGAVCKQDIYESITEILLMAQKKKLLAVMGHGRFHHFTYGLCRYADSISKNYSYVHIDHHSDSWRRPVDSAIGLMHCANFVPFILEDTNAKNVLYLGTNIKDDYDDDLDEGSIEIRHERSRSLKENISGFFYKEKLVQLIDSLENDVYISMDLDVMDNEELITGYDRGHLTKHGLFTALSIIKSKKRIIGADIVGYSTSPEDIINTMDNPYKGIAEISLFLDPEQFKKDNKKPISKMQEEELKERSFKLYQDIAALITS